MSAIPADVPEVAVFCRRCEQPYQAVDAMWAEYAKLTGPYCQDGPGTARGNARRDTQLFALVTIADALSAIADVLAPGRMRPSPESGDRGDTA